MGVSIPDHRKRDKQLDLCPDFVQSSHRGSDKARCFISRRQIYWEPEGGGEDERLICLLNCYFFGRTGQAHITRDHGLVQSCVNSQDD